MEKPVEWKCIRGTLRANVAAVAVFLTSMAMIAGAGDPTPDREANYLGVTTLNHGLEQLLVPPCETVLGHGECPLEGVPQGILYAPCDAPISAPQGVGGVSFCDIPFGSELFIDIQDDMVRDVFAWVKCAGNAGPIHLFNVTGSGAGVLSPLCAGSAANPNAAHVWVALHLPPDGPGATQGTVYLTFV